VDRQAQDQSGSASAGPNAWIDRPLDQTHHPLEPIDIMAHASSENGVASFDISIDGEVLYQGSVNGGRLEKVTYIWDPEEPGVYQVRAKATDSNGNIGGEATSVIYIGGAGQDGPINSYGECEGIEHINLVANPYMVSPGECSLVFWEVLAPDHWPVFINGEQVDRIGEIPVCLHETSTVELSVETDTGICNKWEIINVAEGILDDFEPPPKLTIFFEGHPPLINPGGCSMLIWEVSPPEGGETILQGEPVPFAGEKEVCPEEPTQYELIAVRNEVGVTSFVMIDFFEGDPPTDDQGNVTVAPETIITTSASSGGITPTTKPPPLVPPIATTAKPSGGATNTPPVDSTPPTISNASVSPNDFIYNTNGSCSPTVFNFSVNVTDAGGVANVRLNWTGSGVRNGPENMYFSGGKYLNNLGLFIDTGSLNNFTITATDNSGNSNTSSPSWNLDVEECGGGS